MEYAHVAQIQNLIRRALNHTDVPDYTIKISGLKLVREKVVTKSRVGLDAEDDDDNDSSSIEFGGHSSDEEEKKLKTNKEPSKLQYTLHCAKLSRHLLIAGETAEETAGRLVQLLRQTQNNEDSIQQLEVSCQGALVVFTLSFAHFTSNLLYSLYRLCQAPLPSNEISCKRSVVVSLSFGNLFVKSIDVSILRMVFIARHQLQLYNLQPLFTARAVPDFKFWGLETGGCGLTPGNNLS